MMLIEALFLTSLVGLPMPDLKCKDAHRLPDIPANSVVLLKDGEIQGINLKRAEMTGLYEPTEVHSIRVTCWDPETGEIHSRQGLNLILITTTGHMDSSRGEINEAVEALRRFAAVNDELPGSILDLELGGDAVERLAYTHSDSGWTILTSGSRAVTCTASGSDADLVEVDCQVSHELARANLRNTYGQNVPGGPNP